MESTDLRSLWEQRLAECKSSLVPRAVNQRKPVSPNGMEEHPGFKVNPKFIRVAIHSLVYGDVLMKVLHRIRPYELHSNKGTVLLLRC